MHQDLKHWVSQISFFALFALAISMLSTGCLFESQTRVPTVVFMGNSITSSGAYAPIGWNHNSGMAASSLEKDYVHRTLQILKEKGREMSGVLGARDCDYTPCDGPIDEHLHNIYRLEGMDAKYVVVQLGENSSEVEAVSGKLQAQYHALLAAISRTGVHRIFCLTTWGEVSLDAIRNKAIRMAMLGVDAAELVDITKITAEPMNYGDSTLFKNKDVLWHPGDSGMDGIAKILSEAILKHE